MAASSVFRSLNLDVPIADVPPGPPPWLLPIPEVTYTPTSKSDLPSLQRQLALQHVETVTSGVAPPCRIYTDGSLQPDGAAEFAQLFSSLYSDAERRKDPTARQSPTTNLFAATNTPTIFTASWYGDLLRLGYRPPWQIAGVEDEPPFADCRLCRAPRCDTLEHYCLAYPTVRHALPQAQPLDAVCRYLLDQDVLQKLFLQYPRFGVFR
ncbi:hypothetical protein E2C01_086492 [Portunus trituberculatus]|uniref:Uncharacterized protein n=1 Tax=Portunus trituberculatus TaxID=210409 RepID=A0A5B7JGH2_PORTR|nr:hypothetical protein [Portunus trituberculatus]